MTMKKRYFTCSRVSEAKFKEIIKFFYSIIEQPDMGWMFIDSSLIKAPQYSRGTACREEVGIGKSREGNTSKIHLAVDSFG